MSAPRDAKRKLKVLKVLEVEVKAVPLYALEVVRLEDQLDMLFVKDEIPTFKIAYPPRERALPSVPSGEATLAAVYFHFGADSVRNMEGIPDREPVFINLRETRTIPDAEIGEFLRRAETVADAHYRLRKLGELAGLRALLGDAVLAPHGRTHGPVLWHTLDGLQVEYGRNTHGGFPFEPSPTATARFSIYASGTRVPLTADELAAKVARWHTPAAF